MKMQLLLLSSETVKQNKNEFITEFKTEEETARKKESKKNQISYKKQNTTKKIGGDGLMESKRGAC